MKFPKNLAGLTSDFGIKRMPAPSSKGKALTYALKNAGKAGLSNAGSNAQTEKYGKAMRSAFKNTKTFGVPGAK